jgi:RNA polymerase sigma factor (sigma-70 family)
MNDWQWVAAWMQGDEQAFESLVRKYFPMVYSAAVRQVNDPHLAEEIAQSVFILFSRKAARLSENVLLTGWFLRTTRFVARDALKQMNRRLRREQQAVEFAAMAGIQGEPGWAALAPLMDEALLALSAREQACVLARFLEGQSFREIGEQQRITEDTAQKRVSRSLDKMRAFLERRGLKVAVPSIVGLLSADLARAAGPQLVETALNTVQAAAQGQAVTAKSVLLADHIGRLMARQSAVKLVLSIAAVVLLVGGGGFLIWNQTQSTGQFQVSDNRIDVLGRAWAAVVQRAAFLMGFPQGRPPAGDPNRAAYDQATTFVLTETTRVSTELNGVLQEGRDREQLAEFLTVELRETLGLDPRQQTELFTQLRARVSQGATFKDGLQMLWGSKTEFGIALRGRLSSEQRQRFDQTYGTNAIGILAFPGLVLGSEP